MARSHKMKHEPVDVGASMVTPPASQTSNRQDAEAIKISLRADSHPACPPGISTTTADTTPAATNSDGEDTEMAEATDHEPMASIGDQSRQLIQVIRNLEALQIRSTLPSLPASTTYPRHSL